MKTGDFPFPIELEDWGVDLSNFPAGRGLETDFFQEVSAFKSQLDPRLTLFNILKERGGHVLSEASEATKATKATKEAASLLENMTEADLDSLLRDVCHTALSGLFKSESDILGILQNDPV